VLSKDDAAGHGFQADLHCSGIIPPTHDGGESRRVLRQLRGQASNCPSLCSM
jgi:hypothetical protein